MRRERAEALLPAGEGNVSDVAYAIGFVSLAGFSRAYKRRFGVPLPPPVLVAKTELRGKQDSAEPR